MSDTAPIGADVVVPPHRRPLTSPLKVWWWRTRHRVTVGRGVTVARGARVCAEAPVTIGDGAYLGPRARIDAVGGPVEIGARARLGERSVIVALAGVTLGEDAVLGEWAVLSDAVPDAPDVERPLRSQPLDARPISIGAGARIGAHAVLQAGATIAPGEAVPSYAVVPTPARSS